ncbi:MAG: hypothetical protein Q4C43_09095 [Prevotella sp.]|nr:hypothetical protein [Prevotella sp.]
MKKCSDFAILYVFNAPDFFILHASPAPASAVLHVVASPMALFFIFPRLWPLPFRMLSHLRRHFLHINFFNLPSSFIHKKRSCIVKIISRNLTLEKSQNRNGGTGKMPSFFDFGSVFLQNFCGG